eukprot:11165832-Lingulodinium_polyedra.AAC.1
MLMATATFRDLQEKASLRASPVHGTDDCPALVTPPHLAERRMGEAQLVRRFLGAQDAVPTVPSTGGPEAA